MNSRVVPSPIIALVVALVVAGAGCTRAPTPTSLPDAVLIVIDTLRADHLSLYGYERPTTPELEAFARDAVTYERAISPGTWTVPSHGSLFTGRWPSFHGAERVPGERMLVTPLRPEVPTLAERLRARGLHTAAFVGNSTYVAAMFGFARGFDEFVADGLNGPRTLRAAVVPWLRRASEPFFLFVNVLDPHEPYEPPAPFDALFPGKQARFGTMLSEVANAGTPLNAEMLAHFRSQYDGEIALADDVVGDVLATLKETGRYERALIVVTSDHGELLGEHGLAGHGMAPYEPEVHVPLLVKYPGKARAGERVARPVSTMAVFATILRHAGIAPDGDVQSRPLDEPHPVWVEDIDSGGARVRVGYDGTLKLVRSADADAVYDLAADPAESRRLDAAAAGALRSAMDAFSALPRPENLARPPALDPEREAQLRALGYVE